MRRVFFGVCICLSLAGCTGKKSSPTGDPLGEYLVIDIASGIGEYQKAYCSDFFSSMELITLETNKKSLIGDEPVVLLHDQLIFIHSITLSSVFPPIRDLYVFDRSGKFLNQIGKTGNGPGEYRSIDNVFLNRDKPAIYIEDNNHILEYELDGTFIRSFRVPKVDGENLFRCSYAGNNLFVGQVSYNGKNKYKYCLFDQDGNIVKGFPSYFFYEKVGKGWSYTSALNPVWVDDHLYLKDYVNDTLYTLTDSELHPAYIFDFGKYSIPIEKLSHDIPAGSSNNIVISGMVGTPDYIFYHLYVPEILSRPKSRPILMSSGRERSTDAIVYGIYHIKRNANIFLDTDPYQQKGLINDINGGLSFIPQYYAGNGVLIDFWKAEDMKEMLTEEYFATQKTKDRQAHQQLRELLKKMKDEDNGVIVVAKLK
ncbi:MAG: 6-bladed beta-propeller [Bacteroidales bacterium]|jgi:hypothetical protein|nr:6-bladed beta-propeller [Bacteroidales bacterium]